MGIYSLNATRYLTGEEPAKLNAVASTIDNDGRFNEVEENVAWTTLFPSGIVASCSTLVRSEHERILQGVRIQRLAGDRPWRSTTTGFTCTDSLSGKEIDELNPARDPYQFTAQADHFSNCVQNNLEPKTPGEEGLKDMRLIAEIYRAAGVGG